MGEGMDRYTGNTKKSTLSAKAELLEVDIMHLMYSVVVVVRNFNKNLSGKYWAIQVAPKDDCT
jgi:hypothetical protein